VNIRIFVSFVFDRVRRGFLALTFTAADMRQVVETPRYMRSEVTDGDGTTALVPTIRARRGFR
jgi:hypothetical protein